jgi:hypothetical protein
MNPLMAMDCIACAVMPTAARLTPVAVQNRITRSCAVSGVEVFAIATPSASFFADAATADCLTGTTAATASLPCALDRLDVVHAAAIPR